MRALTIHQPWASMVISWGKDVENRSRGPGSSAIGQRIAIHIRLREPIPARGYMGLWPVEPGAAGLIRADPAHAAVRDQMP